MYKKVEIVDNFGLIRVVLGFRLSLGLKNFDTILIQIELG